MAPAALFLILGARGAITIVLLRARLPSRRPFCQVLLGDPPLRVAYVAVAHSHERTAERVTIDFASHLNQPACTKKLD